jgi:hypothetical protein
MTLTPLCLSAANAGRWLPAAICNGGIAFTSGLSTYDNQQPQVGCINSTASSAAYWPFKEYATATFAQASNWTGSELAIVFSAGSVESLVTYCIHRYATDTASGDAQLLGAILTTHRSQ